MNFTNPNSACSKDYFPLPRIDQMVDVVAGHKVLSFLDTFSEYNQIKLTEEDHVHTLFVTEYGTYCYKVMYFGLKNAGTTYQCMVMTMFKLLLGTLMEAYMDYMVVKRKKTKDNVRHLTKVFEILKTSRMKLNLEKCTFGVPSGKFLGYLVINRGIELNPKKIQAIMEMCPLTRLREVQMLMGRIVALS